MLSFLHNMLTPVMLPPSNNRVRLPLRQIIEVVHTASPKGSLYSLSNPTLTGPVVYASIDLRDPGNFLYRDIVRIDASDGRILSIWHYSNKNGLGDWILWLMHPLHLGTLWGMIVKILWAALGLSLVLLTITGLLMYWNGVLRRVVSRSGVRLAAARERVFPAADEHCPSGGAV